MSVHRFVEDCRSCPFAYWVPAARCCGTPSQEEADAPDGSCDHPSAPQDGLALWEDRLPMTQCPLRDASVVVQLAGKHAQVAP